VKYSVVCVTWADAHCGVAGWHTLEEYEDDGEALVHTVGLWVPAGEPGSKVGHMTVWQSLSGSDGIGVFHIPAPMVRSVCVLTSLDCDDVAPAVDQPS
jgi:hypothetical protein